MIRNLAYVGFRSPNADDWRTFAPDVLGGELAPDGPDGAVRVRLDDAAWRIAVHPGESDDIAYLGWDVDDLDATVAAVERAGLAVADGAFVDPFGFRHELVEGIATGDPFRPGRAMSGFVTGAQGLGHVVLIVPDIDAAEQFYVDVLGMRPSDTIDMGITVRFLHCAGREARHHTLAISAVPRMVGVHHLMVEVNTLDDVGTALDVVHARNLPVAMSLGRHTNDLMTSFYVRSPSGFDIEYGTGGVVVDDDTWQKASYNAMSIWGHKPPTDGALLPAILRPVAS